MFSPRLGPTVLTAFSTTFQTHAFSILPSSFSQGFKGLVASTLNPDYATRPPLWMATLFSSRDPTQLRWDQPLWLAFEQLGMIERYESLISSVCYEHIESHILTVCAKVWDRPALADMRAWMTDQIVPWLIMPYARGARTGKFMALRFFSVLMFSRSADEARTMLQGIGSRLDFHVCKTLADLRYVQPVVKQIYKMLNLFCRTREIFDIIVDFPDSRKALEDLKVCETPVLKSISADLVILSCRNVYIA